MTTTIFELADEDDSQVIETQPTAPQKQVVLSLLKLGEELPLIAKATGLQLKQVQQLVQQTETGE